MFETSLETFYYVLLVVFLFYWLKKKFFSAKDVINDIQPKEIILEVRTVVEKPKKIKKYALNVSSIKLTLYPNETFKSAKLNKLYQEVVVKHYLLDEPFHTLFVYLLRQIEINNLWVKNYAKKEFIINIRDEQNREVKKVGFRIFDMKDIVSQIVDDTMNNNKFESKYRLYLEIITNILFAISQSDNIKKSTDTREVIKHILSKLNVCEDTEFSNKIIKIYDSNHIYITKVFKQSIRHIDDYGYTKMYGENICNDICEVNNFPKKELLSIKSTFLTV